jgi:hypothetical protein
MEQLREALTALASECAAARPPEARRQFECCRRILRNELGIHPSDQLRDLIGSQYASRRS